MTGTWLYSSTFCIEPRQQREGQTGRKGERKREKMKERRKEKWLGSSLGFGFIAKYNLSILTILSKLSQGLCIPHALTAVSLTVPTT